MEVEKREAGKMSLDGFGQSLVSGAVAGFVVDTTLYPLDTLKTRLQAVEGFRAAGGFVNVYRGIAPVMANSVPSAALFFTMYETVRARLSCGCQGSSHLRDAAVNAVAAGCGETTACLVRVPCEIVKQRCQTNAGHAPHAVAAAAVRSDGLSGLYRGFGVTVLREIPFAALQFSTWEYAKSLDSLRRALPNETTLGAVAGALSGAFAGAATTPLDVAKTRIMLAPSGTMAAKSGVVATIGRIVKQEGLSNLFSGVVPRTAWMFVGGFVFLGSYELCRSLL